MKKFKSSDSSSILGLKRENPNNSTIKFIKIPQLNVLRSEIRINVNYFRSFQLNETAKWNIELLQSVVDPSNQNFNSDISMISKNTDFDYNQIPLSSLQESDNDIDVQDALTQIQIYFDLREYAKAFFSAETFLKRGVVNERILFLQYYSKYLHEQIQRPEEANTYESNSKIKEIEETLEEINNSGKISAPLLFLLGLIYKKAKKSNQAINCFINVLNLMPLFWSAWVELSKLLVDIELSETLNIMSKLTNHWAKNFFYISLLLEYIRIQDRFDTIIYDLVHNLLLFFPQNSQLLHFAALVFQSLNEHERSSELFFVLLSKDPYRLEGIDVLSNILYIKEQQNELGRLAIACWETDRFKPETCCVLGNYYSLLGEHAKAVEQFKRAISLNKNFLSAYTLLGHEYLELKAISLAIEAYNSCVQINKQDYRAWYGLGQAYEIQNHSHFAIYYFQQALISNCRDARMWNALGNCYEKTGRNIEASKCYEKSQGLKDQEGISLFQLGKLYKLMKLNKKSLSCFEENLRRKDSLKIFDKETAETLLLLSQYYKETGEVEKSLLYAHRLLEFSGVERQEAQNIIYELSPNY